MFGSNYFGQPTFGQGPATLTTIILELIRATTRFISGFNRYTRREY